MDFKNKVFDKRNDLKIAADKRRQSALTTFEKLIYENGQLFDEAVLNQLKVSNFASINMTKVFNKYLVDNFVSTDIEKVFEEFLDYKLSELGLVVIGRRTDPENLNDTVVIIALRDEKRLGKREYQIIKRKEFYATHPEIAEQHRRDQAFAKQARKVLLVVIIVFFLSRLLPLMFNK